MTTPFLDPYADHVIDKELRNLLVCYGVEKVNTAWVNLLTLVESQLKKALHPEVKPKTPEVVLMNTIETQVALPVPKGPPKPVKEKEWTPPPIAPIPEPVPEKVMQDKKMADLNKRRIHKETIAKQKEKLDAQGINGRQLLTADAMKKWIDDGKTYWDIAEQTGVPDADISVLAKSFGLQSKVSKLIGLKK